MPLFVAFGLILMIGCAFVLLASHPGIGHLREDLKSPA